MRSVPSWLKKRIVYADDIFMMKRTLSDWCVNTVCESALCPNLNECYAKKQATFMILGNACTRSCRFCSVGKTSPQAVDDDEPSRIAEVICELGAGYAVITSATRDDLADGGAGQFVKVIEAIRGKSGDTTKIEVLTSDFNGLHSSVRRVLDARPDVFGHNIETVRRLYQVVRPEADYDRSLHILKTAKNIFPGQITKSAVMVGLGETEEEVFSAMRDIKASGCDILVIGQYLRPGPDNIAVDRFVRPEEFDRYKRYGEGLGFAHVAAGPFVRSSYRACEIFNQLEDKYYDRCYAAAVS